MSADKWQKQALEDLANYEALTQATLDSVNKRFSGNIKARILTFGGEVAMSTLMDYILKSNGLDSCHVSMEEWPIVTDDNFEDAVPHFAQSKKRLHTLIGPLEDGKILCLAGFLGMTSDGLRNHFGKRRLGFNGGFHFLPAQRPVQHPNAALQRRASAKR